MPKHTTKNATICQSRTYFSIFNGAQQGMRQWDDCRYDFLLRFCMPRELISGNFCSPLQHLSSQALHQSRQNQTIKNQDTKRPKNKKTQDCPKEERRYRDLSPAILFFLVYCFCFVLYAQTHGHLEMHITLLHAPFVVILHIMQGQCFFHDTLHRLERK